MAEYVLALLRDAASHDSLPGSAKVCAVSTIADSDDEAKARLLKAMIEAQEQ